MGFGLDMEYSDGIMEKYLKENGKMGLRMVLVYGNLQKATIMKDNGFRIGSREKVYSNIGTVLITVNLKIFLKMDMVYRNLQMVINMKVNIKAVNLMEEVNINGMRVVNMMDNS
jgi:hypothetical protein